MNHKGFYLLSILRTVDLLHLEEKKLGLKNILTEIFKHTVPYKYDNAPSSSVNQSIYLSINTCIILYQLLLTKSTKGWASSYCYYFVALISYFFSERMIYNILPKGSNHNTAYYRRSWSWCIFALATTFQKIKFCLFICTQKEDDLSLWWLPISKRRLSRKFHLFLL